MEIKTGVRIAQTLNNLKTENQVGHSSPERWWI
jgi:hypothetical protein